MLLCIVFCVCSFCILPVYAEDEREEIIGDITSYVGLNAGNLFKDNGPQDDPDIRFVRNEKYGSDYEIIRHHRSYKETMGEG